MKIAIAVSHVDLKLAANLATRLRRLHDAGAVMPSMTLVVSTWTNSWEVRQIADYIAKFTPSEFLVTPDPQDDKWPEAPTHLFVETAKWFDEHNADGEPWFFFEPDCFPLRPDWVVLLNQEWEKALAADKHYVGVENVATLRKISTGEFYEDLPHMVGAGIYPPDFLDRCKTLDMCGHWPWDVAIADEVVPELYDTKLIAHRWNTFQYVRGDDGLYHGKLTARAIEMHSKPPQPIGTEVAVVHGCKDDSIFKLASTPKAS